MKLRSHIFVILRTAATVGLLTWLLTRVEWQAVGKQLANAELGWFFLALAMPAGALAVMSLRWRRVLQLLGISKGFPEVLRLTLIGQFFNSFLPGATGGDLYKITSVCLLHPERKALAASSVVIDRIFATIALGIMGCLSVLGFHKLWLSVFAETKISAPWVLGALAALAVLCGLGLLALWKTNRIPKGLAGKVQTYLGALGEAQIHHPSAMLPLSLQSLAIHFMNFSGAFFLAKALQIDVSYLQMLSLMPVLLLAVLLPLSINGHGIRELVLIGYFSMLNIHSATSSSARDISITFSMLYVIVDSLWCLPGAVLFLNKRRNQEA